MPRAGSATIRGCLETGGSILPIGGLDHGHKGFALSLLIEALTQGLSGHGRVDAPKDWGASVLVLALAPSAFGSSEAFCRQVEGIADACKAAAPIPDGDGVRLPGEQALARKQEAERRGVELDPRIATQLTELAARFGIAMAARAFGQSWPEIEVRIEDRLGRGPPVVAAGAAMAATGPHRASFA